MTKNEKQLFEGLNGLCDSNEAFYYSEQDYLDNYIVRSYSYRLATHSDSLEHFAKESRGTAFIYNKTSDTWELFCRAYPKFFNLGEICSKEEYIRKYEPLEVFDKADGSLILIGEIDGKLITKSKTSLNSEQAKMAQILLDSNKHIQDFCTDIIMKGFSPVFELVGPDNKIIVNYKTNELILLGVVNNQTGEVTTKIPTKIKQVDSTYFTWGELLCIQERVLEDIEGYVVRTSNNEFVKLKTNRYKQLHSLKDSISNTKNLVKLILDGELDDIYDVFSDDKVVMSEVERVQSLISKEFNHKIVEFKELRRKYFSDFEENRKEFAMKYNKHELFGPVMKTLNSSFRDVNQVAEYQVRMYIEKMCNKTSKAEEYVNKLSMS